MKYEIEERLAQDTLNYLANQPYKDVARLIAELSRLKPIEDKNLVEKKGE